MMKNKLPETTDIMSYFYVRTDSQFLRICNKIYYNTD